MVAVLFLRERTEMVFTDRLKESLLNERQALIQIMFLSSRLQVWDDWKVR